MPESKQLLEVSWEVCNFVGGINTVIKTKANEAVEHFKGNYILIGPWLDTNDEFVEAEDLFSTKIKNNLNNMNLKCKFGYWNIPAQPKVILVAYKNRYESNELLYQLWQNFGVESYAAEYDYIEPVLFSTAAAQVIEAIAHEKDPDTIIYAQFHEWLTGAGLLYLKKHAPDIATTFTTHATVIGRSLAAHGKSVFDLPNDYDYNSEARKYTILAKHSLESITAREADSFTTVSYVTADETNTIFKKYPDKVTFNGMNFDKQVISIDNESRIKARLKLLEVASTLLGLTFPENTRIWMTSGRPEVHNKGYDALLTSLAELDLELNIDSPPIIVFFLVATKRCEKKESLLNPSKQINPNDRIEVLTHHIDHPYSDGIYQFINHCKFNHRHQKIHVIYSPAILNGSDGVFDIPYYELLSACDLTIFPSFYEPWGYTPLESITYGIPTITTDLAGFGVWIKSLSIDYANVVYVIERRNIYLTDFVKKLKQTLALQVDKEFTEETRTKAKVLAKFADWKFFFQNYLDAYEQANDAMVTKKNEVYIAKFGEEVSSDIIKISARAFKMRALMAHDVINNAFKELVNYSYNFWWSWQLRAYKLFKKLNPSLWRRVKFNPLALLNEIPRQELKEKINTQSFKDEFNKYQNLLNNYLMLNPEKKFYSEFINEKNPIAYFCMEYGLHESLPFYAGGLGILAGDHLKTASDIQMPMVAVGLLYKYGYFKQTINSEGNQIAKADFFDHYDAPLTLLKNDRNKEILIELEFPGRICYLRIWMANIGKIILYLLDTDTPHNNEEDKKITLQLYPPHNLEIRLLQRIVLGIGGVKLLNDILKIKPALYHLNECHTAFLILERIKNLVVQGITPSEAVEIVRKTTLYTIHTSVPAAQEIYSDEIIKKYFLDYVTRIGIDISDVLAQGRVNKKEYSSFFSLIVSSIRSSFKVNGVSKLHGKISQKLWQDLWPDALESEIPIGSITNGIHIQSWLGCDMWDLYNKYLPDNWLSNVYDDQVWEQIAKIPDKEVWDAHQLAKQRLIMAIKEKIRLEDTLRGDQQLIEKSLHHLRGNVFIIGFSRRIVEYKRPTLIFNDPKYLASILTNPKRPAVLLMAGKAHPHDNAGKEIIHEIIQETRQEMYDGRVIFIEDYDISISQLLVAGCDIWLNNPLYGMEACGTSGMKAAINGVINYSVKDGWWYEAYTSAIGWDIPSFDLSDRSQNLKDDIEDYFLLRKLEKQIIRQYYDIASEGYPIKWVKKMKAGMMTVGKNFNSHRMLFDYYNLYYFPLAKLGRDLIRDQDEVVKNYVKWKHHVIKTFKSIKVLKTQIREINKNADNIGPTLNIHISLHCDSSLSENLAVDLLLMRSGHGQTEAKSLLVPLKLIKNENSVLSYALEYDIQENGLYAYTIRVAPCHPLLRHPTELGVVLWI